MLLVLYNPNLCIYFPLLYLLNSVISSSKDHNASKSAPNDENRSNLSAGLLDWTKKFHEDPAVIQAREITREKFYYASLETPKVFLGKIYKEMEKDVARALPPIEYDTRNPEIFIANNGELYAYISESMKKYSQEFLQVLENVKEKAEFSFSLVKIISKKMDTTNLPPEYHSHITAYQSERILNEVCVAVSTELYQLSQMKDEEFETNKGKYESFQQESFKGLKTWREFEMGLLGAYYDKLRAQRQRIIAWGTRDAAKHVAQIGPQEKFVSENKYKVKAWQERREEKKKQDAIVHWKDLVKFWAVWEMKFEDTKEVVNKYWYRTQNERAMFKPHTKQYWEKEGKGPWFVIAKERVALGFDTVLNLSMLAENFPLLMTTLRDLWAYTDLDPFREVSRDDSKKLVFFQIDAERNQTEKYEWLQLYQFQYSDWENILNEVVEFNEDTGQTTIHLKENKHFEKSCGVLRKPRTEGPETARHCYFFAMIDKHRRMMGRTQVDQKQRKFEASQAYELAERVYEQFLVYIAREIGGTLGAAEKKQKPKQDKHLTPDDIKADEVSGVIVMDDWVYVQVPNEKMVKLNKLLDAYGRLKRKQRILLAIGITVEKFHEPYWIKRNNVNKDFDHGALSHWMKWQKRREKMVFDDVGPFWEGLNDEQSTWIKLIRFFAKYIQKMYGKAKKIVSPLMKPLINKLARSMCEISEEKRSKEMLVNVHVLRKTGEWVNYVQQIKKEDFVTKPGENPKGMMTVFQKKIHGRVISQNELSPQPKEAKIHRNLQLKREPLPKTPMPENIDTKGGQPLVRRNALRISPTKVKMSKVHDVEAISQESVYHSANTSMISSSEIPDAESIDPTEIDNVLPGTSTVDDLPEDVKFIASELESVDDIKQGKFQKLWHKMTVWGGAKKTRTKAGTLFKRKPKTDPAPSNGNKTTDNVEDVTVEDLSGTQVILKDLQNEMKIYAGEDPAKVWKPEPVTFWKKGSHREYLKAKWHNKWKPAIKKYGHKTFGRMWGTFTQTFFKIFHIIFVWIEQLEEYRKHLNRMDRRNEKVDKALKEQNVKIDKLRFKQVIVYVTMKAFRNTLLVVKSVALTGLLFVIKWYANPDFYVSSAFMVIDILLMFIRPSIRNNASAKICSYFSYNENHLKQYTNFVVKAYDHLYPKRPKEEGQMFEMDEDEAQTHIVQTSDNVDRSEKIPTHRYTVTPLI